MRVNGKGEAPGAECIITDCGNCGAHLEVNTSETNYHASSLTALGQNAAGEDLAQVNPPYRSFRCPECNHMVEVTV